MTGVTPYAALQVTSVRLPGYTESSGSFALSFAGRTDTQTRSELGARFAHVSMLSEQSQLTLNGRAAWAHDFDNGNGAQGLFQALPGTAFTVLGAVPDDDALLLSGGAEIAWTNGVSFGGTFEGEFADNAQTYAGKGFLRVRW